MKYALENKRVSIEVNEYGAELCSLRKEGVEYLWNGDPRFWGRTSPVLFPFVGSLKDNCYRYHNTTYEMTSHGFARDMDFMLLKKRRDSLWFRLRANGDTLEKYPFPFQLDIGYRLDDNKLEISWIVTNRGDVSMPFSIGGHPAFLCPLGENEKQTDCYLRFDTNEDIVYSIINENGLYTLETRTLPVHNHLAKITKTLFDEDALIIENSKANQVSLASHDGSPYITVDFDAPLFGIWSPAGKNAPFICIEPWFGRCDSDNFIGQLEDRKWGNQLAPHEKKTFSYCITLND